MPGTILRRLSTRQRSSYELPVLWLPSVTSIAVAGNLSTFVLWTGGASGWLYEPGRVPQMVSITEHQQGMGPTGSVVKVGPPQLAYNPAGAASVGVNVRSGPRDRNQVPPPPDPTGLNRTRTGLSTLPYPNASLPSGPKPSGGGILHLPGRAPIFAKYVAKTEPANVNDPIYVTALVPPTYGSGNKTGVWKHVRATYFDAPPSGLRIGQPWFRITSAAHGDPIPGADVPFPGGAYPIPNPPMDPQGTLIADLGGGDSPGDLVADLDVDVTDPFAGCCFVEAEGQDIDPDTGTLIMTAGSIQCPGGTAQSVMHGRQIPTVTTAFFAAEDGTRMVAIETGDAQMILPVCTDDTPPGNGGGGGADGVCCVDETRMVLVCPGAPQDGAQVTGLFEQQDDGLRTLSFVDPVDGLEKNGRFYPCPDEPPGDGGSGDCCYDRLTQTLTCTDERDGLPVTVTQPVLLPDGSTLVVVQLPSGESITIPVCPDPPGTCCYEVASGKLRCTDDSVLDGQQVSLIAMVAQLDGSVMAVVQVQGQEGQLTVPICDDNVPDCCFDAETMTVVCNDGSLSGTKAAIVMAYQTQDGAQWVWVSWQGGGGRMPLCPGQTCPPVFCCIDVETMRFVCPGSAEINGRAANITDIVIENGFSWGVLASGKRVPLCGRDCPPPEMCPDCPGCPPGLWMSPDGDCVDTPSCDPPPRLPPPRRPPDDCDEPCIPHPQAPRMANPGQVKNPSMTGKRRRPGQKVPYTFGANNRPARGKCRTITLSDSTVRCCTSMSGMTSCNVIAIDPFASPVRPVFGSARRPAPRPVAFTFGEHKRPAPGSCRTIYVQWEGTGTYVKCCTSNNGITSCNIIATDPFAGRRAPRRLTNPSDVPQWKKDGHCCEACSLGETCPGPKKGCDCEDDEITIRVMNPQMSSRRFRRGPR